MKNRIFARFARAFFIFGYFEDVLVLSTTWNDLICSCADDASIWWQMFNFFFLSPKRWFQFNSRMLRTHFARIMTWSNRKMVAERRSYIFRWRSRCCRRRVCLSSLILHERGQTSTASHNIQNAARKIWTFSNLIQHHPTCCKTSQQGGQAYATCCAQQFCKMLRWNWNVARVWPYLKLQWCLHLNHWQFIGHDAGSVESRQTLAEPRSEVLCSSLSPGREEGRLWKWC